MQENSTDKKIAEATEDHRSVIAVLAQHARRRFRAAPAQSFFVAAFAVSLIALVAYLLWPRPEKIRIATETPPTLESKHEGEDHDEHSQEGAIEIGDEIAALVGIKTEQVANGEIEDSIVTVGKALVAPNGQAIVSAKADGRAVRVLAEPGQNVKAGQIVVVIDSTQVAELRGQLIEAQAKLKLAEQNLARASKSENRAAVIQAKNKMDFAENTLERKKRLAALGAAAGREVAEAEVEYKNAKAEYDFLSNIQVTREQQQLTSELEQSRAVVARIVQSLNTLSASTNGGGGTLSIASPIAGTIVDRHISLGQAVTQGGELMTVMNLGSVVVEAQLPESQATRARVGQHITVRIPGLPDHPFEGRVETVGDAVDPQKRTVPVRAHITNAGAVLKHEMAVEVRIATGARKDSLLVRVAAIVEDEGIKIVYVKEGNRYERRPVTVGTINYQWAEILSGVEAGEEVVTAGAYQLKNMQKGGGEEGGHHDEH